MNESKHRRHAFLGAWLAILGLAASGTASALVLGSIQPGGWKAALADGSVMPGPTEFSPAAEEFYRSQIGQGGMFGLPAVQSIRAVMPELLGDVLVGNPRVVNGNGLNNDNEGPAYEALLMSWANSDNDDPAILNVASWDYEIGGREQVPGAPALNANGVPTWDLTNGHIKFSVRAPRGVWDVSLELIDVNGNSIGWFGHPPSANWTNVVIWLNNLAGQGAMPFFVGSAAFDITQVARIRLNESTQGGVTAFFEPNPVAGLPGVWNAWNHLSVIVPEPGSIALLVFGLAGLAGTSRRVRRRD